MRLVGLLLGCLIASTAWADLDSDFLAVRDAFRLGNAEKLENFAMRLKSSPLEVYVTYYRLRLDMQHVDPAQIKAYLARAEDTPMIDRLRGEWLKQLGKQQQWELFDAEYPRLINEDTELTCYALQSRQRSQAEAALHEVRSLWFSGKGQPDSCGVLFDAARAANIITETDVWQRLRLALELGNVSLSKQLVEFLSQKKGISAGLLEAAAGDADRYLERANLEKVGEGQRVVALFALQRLSKQSPELGNARWDKLSQHFTPAEQQYFYGWLGYEAARKLDPRALSWFQSANLATLNELQLAWRTRASLRLSNWGEVLASIKAMNETQQRDSAWRYWHGRALAALKNPTEAAKIFAPLSAEYNFYGQLAGEELQGVSVMGSPPLTYQPSKQDLVALEALPGVQRTLALYRMDLRTEALKEWSWVVRNFNDQELLTAAEIARRNEMYDRAIGAADKTVNVHDFKLRYLAPYRAALQQHIQENGLDEAWVFGLMRQESRFVTAAKSNVGAAGLMQVMPSTARWIAKKMGLKSYRDELIHQLDTNLRLGTYYMKTVLSWFDGNPVLASAAYNAGPGRARKWRAETPLEGAIYAETIPFDETREYVKKVLSNTMYYAKQFGMPALTLKHRLGVITGKSLDNQQPIPDEK